MLRDGRKWIVLALLVVVSIVAIPATADAAPWLSMSRGKSKVRRELHTFVNKYDYADGWVNYCWRKSGSTVVCSTSITTYDDIQCDMKIAAKRYSYGIFASYPGEGHCHY